MAGTFLSVKWMVWWGCGIIRRGFDGMGVFMGFVCGFGRREGVDLDFVFGGDKVGATICVYVR